MTERGARHVPVTVVQLLVLLSAPVLAGLCLVVNKRFYHDDTYIMLRYSMNWLNGDGITWNPGERVEGYSSFLHLCASTLATLLGVEHVLAPRVVNLISVALLVLLLSWYLLRHERPSGDPAPRLVAAACLALACSSFPLYVWALGGLDAPFYALLLTAALVVFAVTLDRPDEPARLAIPSVLFGLAYLARPETVLFVGVSGLWLCAGRSTRRLRHLAAFTLPVALFVVSHLTWRWLYYRDLLPNTFYVKATGLPGIRLDSGLSYLRDFFLAPPYVLPVLLAALVAAIVMKRASRRALYYSSSFAIFLAYMIWAGGDHMLAFRFWVPVIPLLFLALYHLAAPLVAGRKWTVVAALAIALVAPSVLQLRVPKLNPRCVDPAAFFGRLAGEHIATHWPEGSVVALNTAGSTPYFAPRNVYVDMLGLNNRHIGRRTVGEPRLRWQETPGHGKGDGDYVLAREPDYIIVGPAFGTDVGYPWFLSDLEIVENPDFHRGYVEQVEVFDLRHVEHLAQCYPWVVDGFDRFTWYERRP
jgi:hypothetical protein